MKLLLLFLMLTLSINISKAETYLIVAKDLKASNLLFCSAGYDGQEYESAVIQVNSFRFSNYTSRGRDLDHNDVQSFLASENYKAYKVGKDLKSRGKHAIGCKSYSAERVRKWQIATGNESTSVMNRMAISKP
ncbi:TPA: hypothetical protein MH639_24780 [Klebsiella pneumoniae]|nr:hypothetical protein [Klebsiella pneumoniae]